MPRYTDNSPQSFNAVPVAGADLTRMQAAFEQSSADDLVQVDDMNPGDIMLYCKKLEQRVTILENAVRKLLAPRQ
jgi:hypothetical protein